MLIMALSLLALEINRVFLGKPERFADNPPHNDVGKESLSCEAEGHAEPW